MQSELCHSFARNENEAIKISLREYKGKDYIDIRLFFRPPSGDEMQATKKGITLNTGYLEELKKGIDALERKLKARGDETALT